MFDLFQSLFRDIILHANHETYNFLDDIINYYQIFIQRKCLTYSTIILHANHETYNFLDDITNYYQNFITLHS